MVSFHAVSRYFCLCEISKYSFMTYNSNLRFGEGVEDISLLGIESIGDDGLRGNREGTYYFMKMC